MTLPGCGYVIAREPNPARTEHDHDYLLHGGGVMIAADDPHLSARVPVVEHRIPGLPTLDPAIHLPRGRIPADVWLTAAEIAREALPREVYVAVVYDEPDGDGEEGGYRVVKPDQATSRVHVRYEPVAGAVLELHSHNSLPAWPSETDRRDEKGFRLYGVLGRLDTATPEVSLWLGVYGKARVPVRWEQVFEGDPAPFQVLFGRRPAPARDDEGCAEDADTACVEPDALLGAFETLGALARQARLGRRPSSRPDDPRRPGTGLGLRRPFGD